MKNFLSKLKESFISIFPIAIIVVVLGVTVASLTGYDISKLVIACFFLIFGMALFSLGADASMLNMGAYVGGNLSKSRKIWVFLLLSLMLGFIITIAEPDLAVLASQVTAINKWLFICIVAIGVGIFLALAVLRIIFQVSISKVLIIAYSIMIVLMFFVPNSFLPISIDAGAVTTGPISVPFILSFGLGVSAVRGGTTSEDDSFGLIALTSIGPIISTMILSIIVGEASQASQTVNIISENGDFFKLINELGSSLLNNFTEIALVLAPIIIFFFIYNAVELKLPRTKILRIIVGIIFTYIGIVIYLTGTIAGFFPIASIIGYQITSKISWLLIPVCLVVGFFIAFAEPAIHVLNDQVAEITNGVISKKIMMLTVATGVALSLIISVLRVLFNINYIYLIAPLYIACIILCFFVPKIFVSIAFDSGGVASGSMATGFILPFVMGVCQASGVDVLTGAFGTISLIACLPIFSILIVGTIFKIITDKQKAKQKAKNVVPVEIIEFDIGD